MYIQAVQVGDAVGDVLGEDVMRDSMEEEELEEELQALLSTVESSHEPTSLAEQLSKLQLITPPDTAPADTNSSKKQHTESHSSSSAHHAPLT